MTEGAVSLDVLLAEAGFEAPAFAEVVSAVLLSLPFFSSSRACRSVASLFRTFLANSGASRSNRAALRTLLSGRLNSAAAFARLDSFGVCFTGSLDSSRVDFASELSSPLGRPGPPASPACCARWLRTFRLSSPSHLLHYIDSKLSGG